MYILKIQVVEIDAQGREKVGATMCSSYSTSNHRGISQILDATSYAVDAFMEEGIASKDRQPYNPDEME